jgi:hypothetical protein
MGAHATIKWSAQAVMDREQQAALVAIELLECASGLLSAATRGAPIPNLGTDIARINRQIRDVQARLLPISDPPCVIQSAPRTAVRAGDNK